MTETAIEREIEMDHSGMPVIPVRAHGQDNSGGHQGIHFTMVVSTGTNAVVRLLGRDYDRLEARILACDQPVVLAQSQEMAQAIVNQAAPAGSAASFNASGIVTGPALGQQIAGTPLLAAGTYGVTGFVSLGGTTAAADAQNMQLEVGGVPVITFEIGSQTGSSNSLPAGIVIVIPAGGAVVSINAIAAGTATAVYRAQLVVNPVGAAAAIAGPPQPSGSYLPVGVDRVNRHCDEVWAAATSAIPGRISVIVSRRLPDEPHAAP